jgi:hypothetical protein
MTDIELFQKIAKGDRDAAVFMDTMVRLLHFFDDVRDRDKPITEADVAEALSAALIWLPRSGFYQDNFHLLNPVLMVAIENWHAANEMEKGDDHDELRIAFIIRNSYVDLLTMCALICGGEAWAREVSPDIRKRAHGEGFEGYLANLRAEKAAAGGGGDHVL